mmetsp:Transcript_96965/g.230618  ORF Transcript_96965/g.230618 Transcript_96965/m.230618 type:complete len:204 (-) Transcript_96965:49-660(-)
MLRRGLRLQNLLNCWRYRGSGSSVSSKDIPKDLLADVLPCGRGLWGLLHLCSCLLWGQKLRRTCLAVHHGADRSHHCRAHDLDRDPRVGHRFGDRAGAAVVNATAIAEASKNGPTILLHQNIRRHDERNTAPECCRADRDDRMHEECLREVNRGAACHRSCFDLLLRDPPAELVGSSEEAHILRARHGCNESLMACWPWLMSS